MKLPPPPPVVRLPPTTARQPMQQNNMMMAGPPGRPISGWGLPGTAKPLAMTESWQARFNGLFDRTPIQQEVPPSPPKTPPKMQSPALAVAAASRAAIDEVPVMAGATVSLPQVKKVTTPEGFTIDDSSEVTSKPTMDHMFNEELSFGSLPKIRLPRGQNYNVGFTENNMLAIPSNSTFIRRIESQSRANIDSSFFFKNFNGYFVKIPGTKLQNRLVRHLRPTGAGGVQNNYQDRKPSGRFAKGRPTAAGAKEVAPQSPVSSAPNGTPKNGSRTASFQQKTQTPAPATPAATPAAGEGASKNQPVASSSPAGEKKNNWPRPAKGRRHASVMKST